MLLPISRVICCSLAIVASPLLIAIGSNLAQQTTAIPVPDPAVADAKKVDAQYVDASTLVPQPTDDPPVQMHFRSAVQPNRPRTNLLPDDPHVGLPPDHPLLHHENSEVDGIDVQLPYANFGRQTSPNQVCFDPDHKPVGNRVGTHGNSMVSVDHHGQLLAPEVTLRFGSGCTDAEYTYWKLSSLDKPCAKPAIPHGPLVVEIMVDQPVDFVELMFDGKPLKPTAYTNHAPLSYSIPCPAPGQHWLQARYLSNNVWSHFSKPIRFEVRVPPQPRIIAASDFDRDPTPLARHTTTSITTHSIKVHLADVNHGDHIVAYIDGKPLPSSSNIHIDYSCDHLVPVEGEGHLCCRVFRVEGVVTPGVHKLTVRVVGCGGTCSITSEPSNPIAFHYYNEDAYLLRPGMGCLTCNPAEGLASSKANSPMLPAINNTPVNLDSLLNTTLVTFVAEPSKPIGQIHNVRQRLIAVTGDGESVAPQGPAQAQVDSSVVVASTDEFARAALAVANAEQAEARADARIREYEANLRIEKANRVMSPQSPFYFASAAHFPLREFGLRGEPLERDGILIYEDMAFHFDREGNYEVHFRASAPKMPATMRLQFQIQPHRNSPWYTVTLAPIEFPYPVSIDDKSHSSCGTCEADCKHDSKECCGKARECVCKGHSEILRRCYGEMSEDAKIRRTGTARIGFGVDRP